MIKKNFLTEELGLITIAAQTSALFSSVFSGFFLDLHSCSFTKQPVLLKVSAKLIIVHIQGIGLLRKAAEQWSQTSLLEIPFKYHVTK